MTFATAMLFATQLLLPVLLIVELWRGNVAGKLPSRVSWLAGVLASGTFISYFLLAGRRDWISYYLRVALLVAFPLSLYVSLRKTFGGAETVPWWRSPGSLRVP